MMATVLIVDDERNILLTLSQALQLEGYRTELAAGAQLALDVLGARPVDVVLMDVKMPDMDGVAALEKMRALSPELPNPGYAQFILMTKDMEARERVRSRLMAMVDKEFPRAWVRVTRLEMGPAVGYPVQFRVVGPDTQKVRAIARQVQQVMAGLHRIARTRQ